MEYKIMNEREKIEAEYVFRKGVEAYHDNDFSEALSCFEKAEKLRYPIDLIDSYRNEIIKHTEKYNQTNISRSIYSNSNSIYSSTLQITNCVVRVVFLLLSVRLFLIERKAESMLAIFGSVFGICEWYYNVGNRKASIYFDIMISALIIIAVVILFFASQDTIRNFP
jgi:uncharacterized membrane protein